jgi:hypothetical protein
MKTFCLFKVFPIALHLGKACLRAQMSLKICKPSSCASMCRPTFIILHMWVKWIVATFFYAFQFVMNGSWYFSTHLCKHLHPHISTMIFKICTFALIPIGPIEVSMWFFLWNLSKNIFLQNSMRCFPFVVLYQKPIEGSLSFNLLNMTWYVEASFCNRFMLWISFIQMTKHIIYHQDKMLSKK